MLLIASRNGSERVGRPNPMKPTAKQRKPVSLLAIIPARAGSQRVKFKNIRPLAGHPLIAYSIAAAQQSGIFDRIVVSTDSDLIADVSRHYGADVPFLRPVALATSTSPDIEFLKHAFANIEGSYDAFSILRPTSPFRSAGTIKRAWDHFRSLPQIDSIRAVSLCREHPGKMWVIEGDIMRPFMDQEGLELPYHARQYQDLPKVYVQNSSLEIAWMRCVTQHNSREGKVIAPFLTQEAEGLAIDYEDEWTRCALMVERGAATLPPVAAPPYRLPGDLAVMPGAR